jgi:uncharacterized cupredoxin-like copper-binding protein
MSGEAERRGHPAPIWLALIVAVIAVIIASAALTATILGRSSVAYAPGAMMGASGRAGMMGGAPSGASLGPRPGERGFVAGTAASPRVVTIIAGPGYAFSPSTITVARGETITFQVTTVGPLVHEFMVGPADAVAKDREGTPEVQAIGMMETKSLTFTFDGAGPYAFACHVPGHYEAGMRGSIVLD